MILPLKIGEVEITTEEFWKKVEDIVHDELIVDKGLFNEISSSLSAKIPLTIYGHEAFKRLPSNDAFSACGTFVFYGIGIALALLEFEGRGKVKPIIFPFERRYEEDDIRNKCPQYWPFIDHILASAITHVTDHFISINPWASNHRDYVLINIGREFTYIGFVFGLESADSNDVTGKG